MPGFCLLKRDSLSQKKKQKKIYKIFDSRRASSSDGATLTTCSFRVIVENVFPFLFRLNSAKTTTTTRTSLKRSGKRNSSTLNPACKTSRFSVSGQINNCNYPILDSIFVDKMSSVNKKRDNLKTHFCFRFTRESFEFESTKFNSENIFIFSLVKRGKSCVRVMCLCVCLG